MGAANAKSKYEDWYAEALYDYVEQAYSTHENGYTEPTGQVVSAGKVLNNIQRGAMTPTIAGFCAKVRISLTTHQRWSTALNANNEFEYPDYAAAELWRQSVQEDMLLQNSLRDLYNPGIAKMILNTDHGRVERSKNDLSVRSDIKIEIADDEQGL